MTGEPFTAPGEGRDVKARPRYPLDLDPNFTGGFLEYCRLIRRNRGTLLLMAFLSALVACLLTVPQTPVYQARASIEIQGVNQDFLNMRDVHPTVETTGAYNPEWDVQTQVRVLGSRSLAARVYRRLDLAHRPVSSAGSRIQAWRKALGLASRTPETADLDRLTSNLKVRGQPNSRLIEVSCDSADPQLAAEFVNALTREYIEQSLESRWKSAQSTGEWLERQMQDVRIRLEKSDAQLQGFAASTGLLFTSEKENADEERLRQIQEEFSRTQADRAARQSKYELASEAPPESLPEVLDDGSLKEAKAKLTDLRRQLAELNSIYTPANTKVKRVEAQVAVLETSIEKDRASILDRIRTDFETARRRESLLAKEYAAQSSLVSKQAANVAHYNILKREVDTNRQMYDSMLQRVKEAGVASALRASNIRVVDPALPPSRPYRPSVPANTFLGLISGTLFGIVFIVMRQRADRTIQEPRDSRTCLGVPELGLIPSACMDHSLKRSGLRPVLRGESGSLALVTWRHKQSVMAESFRAALTSILFRAPGRERPRVMVLSSAAPQEGKTTVAANLAIALAETGCRVLLIDADLRKPHLDCVFGVPNEKGLADVLRQAEPVHSPLAEFVRTTEIPGLSVLTSGQTQSSEAALLYSSRLEELLNLARREYDAVLIDTPPMLTMADARVAARCADGVVLVVRANRTSRDSIQAACERFDEDGSTVLGVILNDWNPARSTAAGSRAYYERYREYYAKVAN